MVPGAPAADAPIKVNGQDDWFLAHAGDAFTLVHFTDRQGLSAADREALYTLGTYSVPPKVLVVTPGGCNTEHPTTLEDSEGLLASRYDARPNTSYLLRPDQHVCARWRSLDPLRVHRAMARACAMSLNS